MIKISMTEMLPAGVMRKLLRTIDQKKSLDRDVADLPHIYILNKMMPFFRKYL